MSNDEKKAYNLTNDEVRIISVALSSLATSYAKQVSLYDGKDDKRALLAHKKQCEALAVWKKFFPKIEL